MHALRSEFAERPTATGKNGIGQKIALRGLDQEGGVIDQGRANFGRGQTRSRSWIRRNVDWPARRAAGEFPAQDVPQKWRAFVTRIEKSTTVAMVGDGMWRDGFHVCR